MTRALIADDERLMREQLRARLKEVWPELEIVAEAKNGQEAVDLTAQHRPDIVFLDIRMPVITGVDAARQIAQLPTYDEADGWPGCEIVFITAYDQYAVQAFEQGVVDYVLKPAERERLLADRAAHQAAHGRAQPVCSMGTGQPAPLLPTHSPDMQQLLQRLAGQINPQGSAKSAVDTGQRASEHPDDSGGGGAVLHLGREVHAGADRHGGGADSQADQGTG